MQRPTLNRGVGAAMKHSPAALGDAALIANFLLLQWSIHRCLSGAAKERRTVTRDADAAMKCSLVVLEGRSCVVGGFSDAAMEYSAAVIRCCNGSPEEDIQMMRWNAW